MVDVKVLQIVEVVMGTETSIGVMGEPVEVSTEELCLVGGEDSLLGAELVKSLGEGDAVFSAPEIGVIDSALESDSALEGADDVGADDVGFVSSLVEAEIEETVLSDSVLEYDSILVTADEDSVATSLLPSAGDVDSDGVVALDIVSVVAEGALGVEAG